MNENVKEVKVFTPEDDAKLVAEIEEYKKLDEEKKELEAKLKVMGTSLKTKLKERELASYVTPNYVEASLVESTTQSFDEEGLLAFLRANKKDYLIKEVPILDAVKSEIKNKIITESALDGIRTTTTTTKLYVKTIKK